MRREFREQFDSTVVAHSTGSDAGDRHAAPHVVQQVSVGDMVRLKSLGRDGKVLRHLDDDSFEIAVGPMKMKVARDDIAEVVMRSGADPVSAARARGINVALAREDDSVPTEINVIGQNVDDASRAVEKFVDRAFLAGADSACAWCMAAAWESCVKRCGSCCRAIPMWRPSPSLRRTKAAPARRWWS